MESVRSLNCWLVVLALCCAPVAVAQEGPTVDVFRGPVVSSSRIIGLGGAYTGIAEGTQGGCLNSAALANRYPYSTSWFDFDWNLDWVNLLPGSDVDMENDGRMSSGGEQYTAMNVGLALLFGRFGIGVWVDSNAWRIDQDLVRHRYAFNYGYVGAAYAFLDEELVMGLGASTGSMQLDGWERSSTTGDGSEWREAGASEWKDSGAELGLLWKPAERPYRVGASFRRSVDIRRTQASKVEEGMTGATLPEAIHIPWRLAVGASWFHGLGGLAYNEARESRQSRLQSGEGLVVDRRYILASLDVVAYGRAKPGSQGMTAILDPQSPESGKTASLAAHAGIESEVWNNRLVVRSGAYLEPPRLDGADVRPHFTLGLDARLFHLIWWDLRAGFSLDLASRYHNAGIGVGFWH